MSQYHLEKCFCPEAIAVVGASERRGSVGRAVMINLFEGGFEKPIIPVNPKHRRVFGARAYDTLTEIKKSVHLAVIATPIETVPGVVEQCAAGGVHAAVIISAGGKEVGKSGKAVEEKINAAARRGGVRIIGPNCLGIACPKQHLNATFAAHMPLDGKMAFVSQSGAICTAILGISLQERIGFSHFVSVGSMLDVDFGDLIDYFGSDPDVESILLYVENVTATRKFLSAARSVSRAKPIVLLKAGKSAAGARAAASHTGAMAGEDAVYDAAFRRAGIIRVATIGELFECAELMAKQPRPRGSRLAIITNSGGGGVMAADALSDYAIRPAELSQKTLGRLDALLPPYWSRSNPIDILGDAAPKRYADAIDICIDAREIDGMLVILNPQAMTAAEDVAEAVIGAVKKHRQVSLFTAFSGGIDVAEAQRVLNAAGIPTYDTPEQAIRAFMHMWAYERNLNLLQQIPPRLSHELTFDADRAGRIIFENLDGGDGFLTEVEAKHLLAAYGLPVLDTRPAGSADEAAAVAAELGFPVAMKILSADISHKSDAGGVRLNLCDADAVRSAFDQIMASARQYNPQAVLSGVTLSPMILLPDFEILLGAVFDPVFGPVIMFGTGGVFTEILKDRAIGLPPLNRLLARTLIEETRIGTLLRGYRHIEPVDMAAMEEIVIRLSQLVIDFPQIAEIDMNPVIVKDGRAYAADARVRLQATDLAAPHHLVISPYPREYESRAVIETGEQIFVRPIQPEDAPMFEELFDAMSSESIHYRFFSTMRHLSKPMLARFTQIDYDRQIALVAIRTEDGRERMLGCCRIISDPDGREGEFAIMVADRWQGQGVGATLLKKCLHIAKSREMQHVKGIVLSGNRQMLRLGRRLGFEIANIAGASEKELHIDLSAYQP